jgi:molecular chaperone GrpE
MSDEHKKHEPSGKNQEKQHASKAQPAADIGELEQQIGELTEALQRERADAVNSRRRHDEALASARAHAKVNVVRELLPIIDNFERALQHVPKDLQGNDYIKGVESIAKQFEKTLTSLGVEKIPTTGQTFDPQIHEAVQMEDGDPETSSGQAREIVSHELQAGYALGEEVIRPAMVKVKSQ